MTPRRAYRLTGCRYYSENAARKSSATKRPNLETTPRWWLSQLATDCAEAVGVFRRNTINVKNQEHQRQVEGLEPTVEREHVCGPDVISTTTVKGAREGARVEIMSAGCPQTAGRSSRSGQAPRPPKPKHPLRTSATKQKATSTRQDFAV